ncbi:MAG: acyltransferase [Terriglobia bacterium]
MKNENSRNQGRVREGLLNDFLGDDLPLNHFAPRLPKKIPSLDGLRAISISFVLIAHMSGTRHFFKLEWLERLGLFGVRVFFVISGFLITTLLLKEFVATGRISIKDFYLRRVFRIFPAFYFFAIVMTMLNLSRLIVLLPGDILHAFTYTMNYHHPHSWYLAHIWSLSVEEQFYLLWPAALLIARPQRGIKIAFAVVLLAPLIRFGSYYFLPEHGGVGLGQQFQTVADSLAIGCFMAGIHNWLGTQKWYLDFLSSTVFLIIPLILIGTIAIQDRPRVFFFAGMSIMNIAVAICIDRYVRFPDGPIGKILNSRPLAFVGVLSYSLYLWQQPFLNRHSSSMHALFPLNLFLTFIVAIGSYYFVERPFLRIKERLSRL